MTAPVVASSATTSPGTTASFAANMPSGIAAGDLLVCFGITEDNNTDVAALSGFTLRTSTSWTTGAQLQKGWLFEKIAVGSDTATWTNTIASWTSFVIHRVTGAGATLSAAYDTSAIADTGAGTTQHPQPPAITTTGVDELVLIGVLGYDTNDSASMLLSGFSNLGYYDANASTSFSATQATAATVTPAATTGSPNVSTFAMITVAYNAAAAASVPTTVNKITTKGWPSQIEVTWPYPDSDGGSAVTSYTLDVSANGGGSWTNIATPTTQRYTHTGLTNGSLYRYRVAATNVAGTGSYTTMTTDVTPQAAPATSANPINDYPMVARRVSRWEAVRGPNRTQVFADAYAATVLGSQAAPGSTNYVTVFGAASIGAVVTAMQNVTSTVQGAANPSVNPLGSISTTTVVEGASSQYTVGVTTVAANPTVAAGGSVSALASLSTPTNVTVEGAGGLEVNAASALSVQAQVMGAGNSNAAVAFQLAVQAVVQAASGQSAASAKSSAASAAVMGAGAPSAVAATSVAVFPTVEGAGSPGATVSASIPVSSAVLSGASVATQIGTIVTIATNVAVMAGANVNVQALRTAPTNVALEAGGATSGAVSLTSAVQATIESGGSLSALIGRSTSINVPLEGGGSVNVAVSTSAGISTAVLAGGGVTASPTLAVAIQTAILAAGAISASTGASTAVAVAVRAGGHVSIILTTGTPPVIVGELTLCERTEQRTFDPLDEIRWICLVTSDRSIEMGTQ